MSIEKLKAELQKMQRFDKEHFLKVVQEWKHFWMNQNQNSKEDHRNYFNRAFGIDANMAHHLADKLAENGKSARMAEMLLAAVEALELIATGKQFSIMVRGVGTSNHPPNNREVILHDPIKIANECLSKLAKGAE